MITCCRCRTDNGLGFCTPEHLLALLDQDSSVRQPRVLAYTTYGEPCLTECDSHDGRQYNWCTKMELTTNRNRPDADHCSKERSVTSEGFTCLNECSKRAYDYYWCNHDAGWGYCTPDYLLDELQEK